MAKEKVTPTQKSVPSSGGVKDGGNSKLTTPKSKANNKCPGFAEDQGKEKIM